MRYTLLEIVQRLLASMESDVVQSISETQEALDVVAIVKGCYYDLIGSLNLPENKGIFGLDASTDDTKPVLMTLPENVITYDWIRYDNSDLGEDPNWQDLDKLSILDFLDRQRGMDPDDPAVLTMSVTIDGKILVLRYRNDRQPNYYILINDRTFLFDSFDNSVGNTLVEDRTLGYGLLVPTFELSNTFIPDLDPRQFQLLIEHSKTVCFQELKQVQNPKAEQITRRQWIQAQKNKDDSGMSPRQPRYEYGRYRNCSPLTTSKRIFGK